MVSGSLGALSIIGSYLKCLRVYVVGAQSGMAGHGAAWGGMGRHGAAWCRSQQPIQPAGRKFVHECNPADNGLIPVNRWPEFTQHAAGCLPCGPQAPPDSHPDQISHALEFGLQRAAFFPMYSENEVVKEIL